MKRRVMLLFLMFALSMAFTSATCDIDTSLLNQDPYPAIPGEKLEVVFTVSNIDSNDCGTVVFEVLEEYPFFVEEGSETQYVFESGTFTKDYNTQKIIPIDYVIDEAALDGDTPLEVRYKSSLDSGYLSKTFTIEVEDVRADFEVFVSSYDYTTKEITFEVLNIGKADIEAVAIEIPKQDGVTVVGTNKENIGDLSSNEDTSSDFFLDVTKDTIDLKISYSDSVQVRRTIEKSIVFDATLFESTKDSGSSGYSSWIFWVIFIIVIWYFWRRRKKKHNKKV